MKERDSLQDENLDDRITLKCILKNGTEWPLDKTARGVE